MAGQKLYEQVCQNIDNLLQVEKTFSEHQEISGKLRISTFAGLQEVWAWVDEMNFVFTHRYLSSVMRAFLDFVMGKVGFLAV